MEATMLKTSSEFPHPGSYALLDGVKVRIIRAERGGDVFVTGEGVARVIASEHLVAFHQDSPIVDQWIDQRVAALGTGAATPTADARTAFCAWHERGFLQVPRMTRVAFSRNLLPWGSLQVVRSGRCWAFTLRARD